MGMSITFGTLFGIEIWETLFQEVDPRIVKKPRYDTRTGELVHTINTRVCQVRVLQPFLDFESSKVYEEQEVVSAIEALIEKDAEKLGTNTWKTEYKRSPLKFVFDSTSLRYLGIKSYKGHNPMHYPQNLVYPLESCLKEAKKKWDSFFPGIAGSEFVYLRVSV